MSVERGTLVAVSTRAAGSMLVGDHALGVTSIVVADCMEFSSTGGSLSIAGEIVDYSGFDDDTDTITLTSATTLAHSDLDEVAVLPRITLKFASVIIEGEGQAIPVRVTQAQYPVLAEGVKDPSRQKSVVMHFDGDQYVIDDLIGWDNDDDGVDPDTIRYPTITNLASDPKPTAAGNWQGQSLSGNLALDSTHADLGLHVQWDHSVFGEAARISPNGNGVVVSPVLPADFDSCQLYPVGGGDLVFTFKMMSEVDLISVAVKAEGYTAAGALVSDDLDAFASAPTANGTVAAMTLGTVTSSFDVAGALAAHPTVEFVYVWFQIGTTGGTLVGLSTWFGSAMVTAGDTAYAYADADSDGWSANPDGSSSGPPPTTVVWSSITGIPATVENIDTALLGKVDTSTPLDQILSPTGDLDLGGFRTVNQDDPISAQDGATKAYVDGIVSGGPGGATDTATAALVNDDTTPSDTRAALDALYEPLGGGGASAGFANPAFKTVAAIIPQPGTSSLTILGLPSVSSTGSALGVNQATTNGHTASRRLEWLISPASSTAVAGWRCTSAILWRGNAAGLGGFKACFRFGPATGQSVAGRMFTGLTVATGAPTDVEPSSLVDMIGVGFDAADTQLQVMHNDSAGVATKVATGITRSSVDRSQIYDLTIECAPNASSLDVTVLDVLTATEFTTTVSTNLLSNTAFLAPRSWCSVGGVSSVIGMALMGYYSESDH